MNILNKSRSMVTVIMLCSAFSAHAGQVNSTANPPQHQMVESALVRKSEEEGRQRIKQELNRQREDDLEVKRIMEAQNERDRQWQEYSEAKRKEQDEDLEAIDHFWKGLKPEAKQKIQAEVQAAGAQRIEDIFDQAERMIDSLWEDLEPKLKLLAQEEAGRKRIQDELDRLRKEDDLQIDRMIEAQKQRRIRQEQEIERRQEIIPITAAIVEARRQDPQPLPLIERRKNRQLSVNTNIKQRRY